MSMYIAETDSGVSEAVNVQTKYITTNPLKVLVVQADGHELERCLSLLNMKNPTREDGKVLRVVMFYGDQAKFIVGNW